MVMLKNSRVRLFYFIIQMLGSAISFLTILILTRFIDKQIEFWGSNIVVYILIQVGGGATNVFLGFKAINSKIQDKISVKWLFGAMVFVIIVSIVHPLLGGFAIGVVSSIVLNILIFAHLGRVVALLNLLSVIMMLFAALLVVNIESSQETYIMLICPVPSIIIGVILVLRINLAKIKSDFNSSINIIKFPSMLIVISLSVLYGATNLYIPYLFHGLSNVNSYIVTDKILSSISIALNGYYMNEGFLKKKIPSPSLIKKIFTLIITISICHVILLALKFIKNAFELQGFDYSIDFYILFLLGIAWTFNFHSAKYLRVVQNTMLDSLLKVKFIPYFILINLTLMGLFPIFFNSIFTHPKSFSISEIVLIFTVIYVLYWAINMILIKKLAGL